MLDVLGNFIHTSSFSSFAFCCSWTLPTGKTVLAHDWQTSPLCRIKHLLFKNSYTEWLTPFLPISMQYCVLCLIFFLSGLNGFCYERAMLTVMRSEVLDRLFYWVKYRRRYCWRTDFVDYLSAGTSNMKQERNLLGKKKKIQRGDQTDYPCIHLVIWKLCEEQKGERTARKASNPWRKTDTFMQIRCGIFLTMQTLVDNKLFALGLWQFVWICKYYRANGEQEKEGEIRLLICNLVLRSEGACNSAVAWG